MAHVFSEETLTGKGMTYSEFVKQWEDYLENTEPENITDEEEKEHHGYKKLNLQRSKRISKSYKIDEELKGLIEKIKGEQIWMVITEDWCGDSAQTLPYISIFSEYNMNINLKIVERDKNLEIMDRYLTNGSRSIPKLVVFDEEGNELFQWGPRPGEAQELVQAEFAKGRVKDDVYQDLHLWYGRNRGKEMEKEFKEILSNLG